MSRLKSKEKAKGRKGFPSRGHGQGSGSRASTCTTGGGKSKQAVPWRRRETGEERWVTGAETELGLVGSQRKFMEGLMGATSGPGFSFFV